MGLGSPESGIGFSTEHSIQYMCVSEATNSFFLRIRCIALIQIFETQYTKHSLPLFLVFMHWIAFDLLLLPLPVLSNHLSVMISPGMTSWEKIRLVLNKISNYPDILKNMNTRALNTYKTIQRISIIKHFIQIAPGHKQGIN